MDNKTASEILESMALGLATAEEDLSKRDIMCNAVEQRLEAINTAQAALRAPMIDLGDDDFGAVLNCAIRYCLNRHTYMPGLVTDFIKPLLPYLNDKTIDVMERDIAYRGPYEHELQCDYDMWESFLADIQSARKK